MVGRLMCLCVGPAINCQLVQGVSWFSLNGNSGSVYCSLSDTLPSAFFSQKTPWGCMVQFLVAKFFRWTEITSSTSARRMGPRKPSHSGWGTRRLGSQSCGQFLPNIITSISCSCSWLVEYICCRACSKSWFLPRRVFPSSAARWRSTQSRAKHVSTRYETAANTGKRWEWYHICSVQTHTLKHISLYNAISIWPRWITEESEACHVTLSFTKFSLCLDLVWQQSSPALRSEANLM